MNRNKRIVEQLGMPNGTANARLRKNILFYLLTKLKENVCFKCGTIIEKVDDLSIEHKLPWEGRSTELFWDLNNIAFSHLKCNRPHNHGGGGVKMERPKGTNWCRFHKAFLPVENFSRESRQWNGLRTVCKEHQHYYRNCPDDGTADNSVLKIEAINVA